MIYREIEPIEKMTAENMLNSGDPKQIHYALLAIAMYGDDWRWAQEICLEHLDHGDFSVQAVAATSLGHIARVHGVIDRQKVERRLQEALLIPELAGYAEDALSDIRMFVKPKIPRENSRPMILISPG